MATKGRKAVTITIKADQINDVNGYKATKGLLYHLLPPEECSAIMWAHLDLIQTAYFWIIKN